MDSSSSSAHNIILSDHAIEIHDWTKFVLRAAVCSVLHPMDYAKTLIQLGYEPIPAVPKRSLFNHPVLALPNIFEYASYIRRTDGILGCYRGLTPKLFGHVFSVVGSATIAEYLELLPYEEKQQKEEDSDSDSDKNLFKQFTVNLRRDVILSVSSLVIQYPFQVISVRMMAQFIGRETLYSSMITSIFEIYKNEGILGFFKGFMPKLIYELALVVLTSTSVFILNKYFIKDKVQRQISAGLTQISFALALYPLKVVSTCMSVQGSRLMAAKEPFSPQYLNWMDCLSDLQARGVERRGNRLFMRTMPFHLKRYTTKNGGDFLPSESFKKKFS